MTPEQAAALRQPFPPEKIGHLPKGGVTLDYVSHGDVTDRLLEVDPAWTWYPMGTTDNGLPALDETGGLWIWLEVHGVRRPGYGEASGGFSPADKIKAAIGDAIRNAAMRFGVALDLWLKDDQTPARTPVDVIQDKHKAEPKPPGQKYQAPGAGLGPITDGQRKLVKGVVHASISSWDEVSGAQALTQLLGRQIANYGDLTRADVDRIKQAEGDELRAAFFASMGMEVMKDDKPADDDPWAVEKW